MLKGDIIMICKNCGNVIPNESIFCTECGASVDSQPTFEPEYTDFADPVACAEEAQACIKKAKVALAMGIVALAMSFSEIILKIIARFANLFTLGLASFIIAPLQISAPVCGIVCMILGFVFSSKPLKADIQPETIDAELYEKYLSAKKTAKISKILCIVALAIMIVSAVISVLLLIGSIVIAVIALFFPTFLAGVPVLSELADMLDIGAIF